MKKYFLVLSLVLSYSCGNNNSRNIIKERLNIEFNKEGELVINNTIKFDIEIADDEYQTSTGLMYRDSIGDNQGMLFIFRDEDYRAFYMKNTRISLDIIYINTNKVITQIYKKAKPYDERSLPSNTKIRYVLELKGGLCDKLSIKEGDMINFKSL